MLPVRVQDIDRGEYFMLFRISPRTPLYSQDAAQDAALVITIKVK